MGVRTAPQQKIWLTSLTDRMVLSVTYKFTFICWFILVIFVMDLPLNPVVLWQMKGVTLLLNMALFIRFYLYYSVPICLCLVLSIGRTSFLSDFFHIVNLDVALLFDITSCFMLSEGYQSTMIGAITSFASRISYLTRLVYLEIGEKSTTNAGNIRQILKDVIQRLWGVDWRGMDPTTLLFLEVQSLQGIQYTYSKPYRQEVVFLESLSKVHIYSWNNIYISTLICLVCLLNLYPV